MSNEGTKEQLKRFFDKVIAESKNPDKKIKKEQRLKRREKTSHRFGF